MHRGTSRKRIDHTLHSRLRWQLSILCNYPQKEEHVIYGDFSDTYDIYISMCFALSVDFALSIDCIAQLMNF